MLSSIASVRVSSLCLSVMNFGDAWKEFMGECNHETTEEFLTTSMKSGENFIDNSNGHQKESEKWIRKWMKRGNRDQIVIATKFTDALRASHGDKETLINTMGNGTKSLHTSLEASLKKLQTSYIGLLYVHWWDFTCSVPELMQSLNTMVQQGKVLHLEISGTPAWVVSKTCVRFPSTRVDGQPSSVTERDIIPMCIDEGMGLAPWGALGGGNFKTVQQRKAKNVQITSITLAYVMQKTPYVIPIVGIRSFEHLKGNIERLSLELSDEDIKEIEGANAFDLGFPMPFLDAGPNGIKNPEDVPMGGNSAMYKD